MEDDEGKGQERKVRPLPIEHVTLVTKISILVNVILAVALAFLSMYMLQTGEEITEDADIQLVEWDNSTRDMYTTFSVKMTNCGNEIGDMRVYYCVQVGTTNTTKSDIVRMAPGETYTYTFQIDHGVDDTLVTKVAVWL